jgi:hypothetical protein
MNFSTLRAGTIQSNLPVWEMHLQALGPTLVAVVVGCLASYIAWQQWRTANHRLRFNLFDRRAAVYEALRDLIGHVQFHGNITAEELGEFYLHIRGAEFLFDDDTRDFIMRTRDTAFKARMAAFARESAGEGVVDTLVDREEDTLDILRAQEERLEQVFSRYLDLSKLGL